MQNTINAAQMMFALAVLPYALAVLMPSWRWLLACVLIAGGALGAIWIQHWIVAQAPGYKERVGDAIGLAIFFGITFGFAAGAITRAVTLGLFARGWSGSGVFALNVAGLFLAVGIAFAPEALREWRIRAPSEVCVHAVFGLDVAGARLALPASPLFNVYLGPDPRQSAYYLALNEGVRDLCAVTTNGARRVGATMIWLHLEGNHGLREMPCDSVPPAWRATFCAMLPSIRQGLARNTDYPIRAHVFAPDAVRMGAFGATRSTYEDSLAGRKNLTDATFVTTDRITPEGQPLTFLCAPSGNGTYCRASYAWRNGAHLDYGFHAASADVIAKGLRVDTVTREAFDALLVR